MLIFRALRFPTRNQVKGAGNPVEHFSARQRQAKTQCTEVSNTGSLRGTGCFDAKNRDTLSTDHCGCDTSPASTLI